MSVLHLILPLALVFACAAVGAFIWTVRSGQLDDVDTPPRRILFEDERTDDARLSPQALRPPNQSSQPVRSLHGGSADRAGPPRARRVQSP